MLSCTEAGVAVVVVTWKKYVAPAKASKVVSSSDEPGTAVVVP